ncbi:MAG: DUF2752 domain-containing protein [Phycisphaerae bacterium]|nr:DUF2752 domain-containing protein [Phycisphaerae bacterium]
MLLHIEARGIKAVWIELEKTTRRPRWAIAPVACGAVWLTLIAAIQFFYPDRGANIVLCPLKRLVDLPCPTCGTTRSALSFLRGDPLAALLYNPLVFTVAVMLLVVLLVRVVFARQVRVHMRRRQSIGAWWVFAALLLGNWVYVICMGR